MSLKVNLRHVVRQDLQLTGEWPVAKLELDIGDEMVQACKPLRYELAIQLLEHNLLVRGRLELVLDCECVRCLKSFQHKLLLPDWTCLLALKDTEAVAVVDDSVDLTPLIREDILLAFPTHPVCDQGCCGLTEKRSRSEKKKGTGAAANKPSAWAELDKLKFRS